MALLSPCSPARCSACWSREPGGCGANRRRRIWQNTRRSFPIEREAQPCPCSHVIKVRPVALPPSRNIFYHQRGNEYGYHEIPDRLLLDDDRVMIFIISIVSIVLGILLEMFKVTARARLKT